MIHKLLRHCGFVFARREGNRKIYSFNLETVKPVLDLAEKHVKNYRASKLRKKACLTYDDPLDCRASSNRTL